MSSSSSSSTDHTEELIRSTPPPTLPTYWTGPLPSFPPTPLSCPFGPPVYQICSSPMITTCQPPPMQVRTCSYDINKAAQLDGHDSSAEQKDRKKSAKKKPEPEVEVSFRHYCARCGRTRSRTFHLEHPVEPGKEPYPGICSRCVPSGGFAPAPRPNSKKKVTEETEELLIRRRCGDRRTSWFKPNTEEQIWVKQRACSPVQRPCTRKHASSSEDEPDDKDERTSDQCRGRPKEAPRIVRIRVRSRSRDDDIDTRVRYCFRDRDEDQQVEAEQKPRRQAQVIRVYRSAQQNAPKPVEPPEPEKPPRPPSPPEWYFKRVRKVSRSGDYDRPEDSACRPKYLVQEEISPYRPRASDTRTTSKVLRAPPAPSARPTPIDKHNPVRGVLQHARHDRLNRSHDLYAAERDYSYRQRAPEDDASDEELKYRRVHFAPEARGARAANQRRFNEAAQDWRQEQRDQDDYNDVKKKTRAGVHKGGGKYELYDVDGHISEDRDSTSKHARKHTTAAKPVYSNHDERSEGALAWLELFGGME